MNRMANEQAQSTIFLKFYTWLQTSFANALVNLIISIIIVLIGFTLARFIGKLLRKLLKELEIDKLFKIKKGLSMSVVIAEIFALAAYIITIILALRQLGIAGLLLEIIAGIVVLFFVISFILWIKDSLPNIISGFMMHDKHDFAVDDHIESESVSGKVTKISLRETTIENSKGDTIVIPNNHLYKQKEITITKTKRAKIN